MESLTLDVKLGYWGGISPTGQLSSIYKTLDVDMEAAMELPASSMRVVAAEDIKRFYEDFYRSVSL